MGQFLLSLNFLAAHNRPLHMRFLYSVTKDSARSVLPPDV
jgi:hypothetical protein